VLAGTQVRAEERQPLRLDQPRFLHQARHGERGEALAGARLPHDPDRVTALHGETDSAHRCGAGEAHGEAVDHEHRRVVRLGHDPWPAAETRGRGAQASIEPDALRDGLAEQVERQPRHDDGDTGCERGLRVQVDRAEPLAEESSPVVVRRLHPEPEERQPGERQQRVARGHGRVHHQGFRDVGQHVPEQDPQPPDPRDPRRGHVVEPGDPGHHRVRQPREARCEREPDGQQPAGGAHAEDHREEQRQQQAGERDRDVHGRRHDPADPRTEQQRRGAEQQPDGDTQCGRQQSELHRETGRDQHAEEDVPPEAVRPGPVIRRRAPLDLPGVDGVRRVGPQHRRQHREQQHDHHRARGGRPERCAQHPAHVIPP
jgi:hypothetical protein